MAFDWADKRVMGTQGRRRDAAPSPVVPTWNTDIVDNKDPDYRYEFPREDEVRDRMRPSRISLIDFHTGETTVHDVPGWEVVHRELDAASAAGFRPDEGKPVDTVLRHGNHVCMRIHEKFARLIDAKKEQRADSYEERLRGGHTEEWSAEGVARPLQGKEKGIRLREEFSPT